MNPSLAAVPVTAAQVRQQLEFRLLADHVLGARDRDTGLIELRDQAVDRHLEHVGELSNGYISHSGFLAPGALSLRLEPMRARLHDQSAGFLGRQAVDIRDVVDALLGQLFTRAHAAARERQRQVRPHAIERQQIVGRHRLIERLPR